MGFVEKSHRELPPEREKKVGGFATGVSTEPRTGGGGKKKNRGISHRGKDRSRRIEMQGGGLGREMKISNF